MGYPVSDRGSTDRIRCVSRDLPPPEGYRNQAVMANLLQNGLGKGKDETQPATGRGRLPALLAGLAAAQAIATVQVYLSNAELHRTLETIKSLGYLPVPNERVMPSLEGFFPAFWGGLFFTVSLGAGLSLLSCATAWAWRRFRRHRKALLALYSILWPALLIAVNVGRFNPAASLYFLLLPPVVFLAARGGPPQDRHSAGHGRWLPASSAVLLAVLWLPHVGGDFFVDVRDRLLLSNRIGQRLNRFYYDHTLHAAQVIKSLDQKTLKTCSLEKVKNAPVSRALERAFAAQDFLNNRGAGGAADLQVSKVGERFVLSRSGTAVMEATLTDLLSRTGPVLKEFSARTDRQAFFRKAVYFSLLFGFPVIFYLFVFDLFRFGLGVFLAEKAAAPAAALVCFFTGAGLLVVFIVGGGGVRGELQVERALASENWGDRVAALKRIEQKGMDIAGFTGYERLLSSPHAAERYWLARALGISRRERTYRDLLGLLDDPQLNVRTMAYHALGRRGDRRAIPELLYRLRISPNWYEQRYAYRALKSLGWVQSRTIS